MFRSQLTDLIILYLLLVLGAMFAIWIGREWLSKARASRSVRERYLCKVCGAAFEDERKSELATCPTCGQLNERDPIREF
jgi:hypothetical protein